MGKFRVWITLIPITFIYGLHKRRTSLSERVINATSSSSNITAGWQTDSLSQILLLSGVTNWGLVMMPSWFLFYTIAFLLSVCPSLAHQSFSSSRVIPQPRRAIFNRFSLKSLFSLLVCHLQLQNRSVLTTHKCVPTKRYCSIAVL